MEDKELDNMVVALMVNYITLSKEDNEICLYGFNKKDPRHWAGLHIASLAESVTGMPVKVNCGLIDFLWIKWKFKKIDKIKRTKKTNINIEKEVSHIEEAYNAEGMFSNIYKKYYSFTDRK